MYNFFKEYLFGYYVNWLGNVNPSLKYIPFIPTSLYGFAIFILKTRLELEPNPTDFIQNESWMKQLCTYVSSKFLFFFGAGLNLLFLCGHLLAFLAPIFVVLQAITAFVQRLGQFLSVSRTTKQNKRIEFEILK